MDNKNNKESAGLKLLSEGSKVGLGSIGKLIGIVLFFSIVNLLLFIYAIYKQNIAACILVAIIGLLCTIYAGNRAYIWVIIDIAKFVYKNASSLFNTICKQIIDQASQFINKQTNNVRIEDIINIQKIIEEKLGKAPNFVRK